MILEEDKDKEVDLNDMDDEAFMKMPLPSVQETTDSIEEQEETKENDSVEETTDQTSSEETKENTEDENVEINDKENSEESEIKEEEVKESKTETDNKVDDNTTDKSETENKTDESNESVEFMNKILKPFKADGKEVSVRSAEDAIRLMQMGSNYSRKMAELKPAKEAKAMLEANNLDTNTLNFLIDIKNGDKDAIQKLLKDHKIDPLDFDTEKEINYQSKDYTPDLAGMNFKEAITTTMEQQGGRELINTIHNDWDDTSKELLKKDTTILTKVLDDTQSGVYEKVNAEREYQIRMGYLPADVPFYEGYQAVEQAMRQVGAFNKVTNTNADNMSTSTGVKTPIDTGPRKAKEEQPNPAPSSVANPQSQPNKGNSEKTIEDFFDMDDDAFNKLAPPKT